MCTWADAFCHFCLINEYDEYDEYDEYVSVQSAAFHEIRDILLNL